MLTNKDIRVENGNIVINGDKYPLDGQSPAAIMEIVEDNSDTTPTAESTAPVTSGGVKTYVDNAVSQLSDAIVYKAGDTIALEYTTLMSGYVANNQIRLFLPTSKPITATGAAISSSANDFSVYTDDGEKYAPGNTLNYTVNPLPLGVSIFVDGLTSLPNGKPVTARMQGTITFS